MKVLKFTLSGKTAFFKKPDTNTYLYFTYGNIHKVALLGIFGAMVGYSGYNQMNMKKELKKYQKETAKNKGTEEDDMYPEFYKKLKDIKVSIMPNNEKAFISKKVQTFNNSVGYASQEMGGNLIIKEQWLENPSWNIYITIDSDESEKLADYILNHKSIYNPYLGKNDHYANISDIKLIEDAKEVSDINKINSLCPKDFVKFGTLKNNEDEFDDFFDDSEDEEEEIFKYQEKLPIGLDKGTNMYVLESFVCSNADVETINGINVYEVEGKNIVFY